MPSGLHVVHIPALATARGMEAATRRGARAGLQQIGREVTTAVRQRIKTSTDKRGYAGRIFNARLRNAVTPQEPVMGATSARQTTGIVGPASSYGAAVEDDRRPGKRMPPPSEIAKWLRLDPDGQPILARYQAERKARKLKRLSAVAAAKRLAWSVARSIGRRGTPGIHMFRDTQKEFAGGRSAEILELHLLKAYGSAA